MRGFKYSLVYWSVFAVIHSNTVFANFENGGFDSYNTTPSPAASITAWTSKGYLFTGYKAGLVLPPKSLDDILLEPTSPLAQGITDIVNGAQQSKDDYFLNGVSPTSTLKLPVTGLNTAMINLRSVNNTKSVSGTSGKPSGWSKYAKQATSLSQTITILNSDFSADGKVHIKFKIAPVMENPAHTAKQQPFYAIQINNLTTGRKGSNPLYFQWSYAAQPGVPWKTLASGNPSVSGSNATYTYTDWQTYDIAFSSSDIAEGNQVELIVLAAGCSPGGHDGHIYLDDVTTGGSTSPNPAISVSATADVESVMAGGRICYTYTFNYSGTNSSGLNIIASMPQTQNSPAPYDTIYDKGIDGITTPVPKKADGTVIGSCTFYSVYNGSTTPATPANSLRCNINDGLGPLVDSYFTMCVKVPSDWQPSYGPINNGNYPISSNTLSPVLGNLVQTPIVAGTPPAQNSNLVVDPSGLLIDGKNPSLNNGDIYPGTHYYTCTNATPGATATAFNATCNITNLPPGFNVTSCEINPGGAPWNQPADIPQNSTVKCFVSGTADSEISRQWDAVITSDAVNNTNSTQNTATVPYDIYNNPSDIPADLNGSSVLTPIYICCGRPVMLYDLPIDSDLVATYQVVSTTGNIRCIIGSSGGNSYVKVFGRPGTCTIQGTKDGQISKPLTLIAQ